MEKNNKKHFEVCVICGKKTQFFKWVEGKDIVGNKCGAIVCDSHNEKMVAEQLKITLASQTTP